jgi:hypothetical protein
MKFSRRQMMKSSSLAALTAFTPSVLADTPVNTPTIVTLQAGLETDNGFAFGASASKKLSFGLDLDDYQALVEAFKFLKQRASTMNANGINSDDELKVIGLVQPADLFLLEQAVRDSDTTLIEHGYVSKALADDIDEWSFQLGRSIANSQHIECCQPNSKDKLFAVQIKS